MEQEFEVDMRTFRNFDFALPNPDEDDDAGEDEEPAFNVVDEALAENPLLEKIGDFLAAFIKVLIHFLRPNNLFVHIIYVKDSDRPPSVLARPLTARSDPVGNHGTASSLAVLHESKVRISFTLRTLRSQGHSIQGNHQFGRPL